jgi:PPK2 family polyphosphate:nucleotide phosphotransferase
MIDKFTVKPEYKQTYLKEFSPNDTAELSKKDVQKEYKHLQKSFVELQEVLFASKKYALLIVLQGMDCSGKDGAIKKVFKVINPSWVNVFSFKEPSHLESSHDYLWRIHQKTPKKGDIVVFNRSYYEDVIVTRVHKNIDDDIAFKRFDEINQFEKYLVSNNTIVLKFFLHISKEFQGKKLISRLKNPDKYWKFSEDDLSERKLWDSYQKCYSDVLSNCSTKEAPWTVVPANHRWFRNCLILKTIVRTIQELNLEYPKLEGGVPTLIQEVKAITGK